MFRRLVLGNLIGNGSRRFFHLPAEAYRNTKVDKLVGQAQGVIEKYQADDFELWESVKRQVKLAEKIVKENRAPTPEESKQLNWGPRLAQSYDIEGDKEQMSVLFTLYNQITARAVEESSQLESVLKPGR